MRKELFVFVAAAVAMTATSAMPAFADPRLVHAPDGVTIAIASINGSGCPPHSVIVDLKQNKDAFRIGYGRYLAQTGGSSIPPDARKNCQVRLKVNVPAGFTYAVSQANYHGYAQLESGASALLKGVHYIQGVSRTRKTTNELKGAFRDDWYVTDTTPVDELVWRPCGEERELNIDTELRVDQGTSDPSKVSFITMDSLSDGPETTYDLAWKECP